MEFCFPINIDYYVEYILLTEIMATLFERILFSNFIRKIN